MTIEQAIIYIIQNTNDEQKQWASDVILGKKEIAQEVNDDDIQYAIPKKKFELKTFNLGKVPTPTREEIYEERNLQIFGLAD